MRAYLNRTAVIGALGLSDNRRLPGPDMTVGWRTKGYDPPRILRPDFMHVPGAARPRRYLALGDVAAMLHVSTGWVIKLRDHDDFADPAVYVGPASPDESSGGVYGWTEPEVFAWALRKDRVGADGKIEMPKRAGRPKGSGDPASLPRCLRPRDASRHGHHLPCMAVRRKIGGVWLPACSFHLDEAEQAWERALQQQLLHGRSTAAVLTRRGGDITATNR